MRLCVLFPHVFVTLSEGYSIPSRPGVLREKIVNALFEGYPEKAIHLWRGYEMHYPANLFPSQLNLIVS